MFRVWLVVLYLIVVQSGMAVIVTNYPPPVFTAPSPTPVSYAHFSLSTNLDARWQLIAGDYVLYRGVGPIHDLMISPGDGFMIIAEQVPGYSLSVFPQNRFPVAPGEFIKAELYYQPQVMPQRIPLPQSQMQEIQPEIVPIPSTQPRPLPRIPVEESMGAPGKIEVKTDISQAVMTLTDQQGKRIGARRGSQASFDQLMPGLYTVAFSSTDPQSFIAPQSQQVQVESGQRSRVDVSYKKMGQVIVRGNVDRFSVKFRSFSNAKDTYEEQIGGRYKVVHLPEGDYDAAPQPLQEGEVPPEGIHVKVSAASPQSVSFTYQGV